MKDEIIKEINQRIVILGESKLKCKQRQLKDLYRIRDIQMNELSSILQFIENLENKG